MKTFGPRFARLKFVGRGVVNLQTRSAMKTEQELKGDVMELRVLFGQRNETYPVEYGLEALGCATEHDLDENPDYLSGILRAMDTAYVDEFKKIVEVVLTVNEEDIRKVMFPEHDGIPAIVQKG